MTEYRSNTEDFMQLKNTPTFKSWLHLFVLALVATTFIHCEEEEGDTSSTTPPPAQNVELPSTIKSAGAAIVMRINNSTSTATNVHRALGRILSSQLDVANVIMRGGYDPDITIGTGDTTSASAEEHAEMLGGSALEQVRAAMDRTFINGEAPFTQEESMDRCGNPMIASFLTPNMLQHVYPLGNPSEDLIFWPGACGSDLDCETTETGIWDVTLTEMRSDGMMDVIINVYPAVIQGLPAFSGHFISYFLTDNHPGFSVMPIFGNAKQILVFIGSLVQGIGGIYFDAYGFHEVFVFPHMEREFSTADLGVSFVASDTCENYWNANFSGEVPFGCDLEAGYSTPLLLDTSNETGSIIKSLYTQNDDTAKLQEVLDTLAYQISAQISCPTVNQPTWIEDDVVEIFVCEDSDFAMCIGYHDMERMACDIETFAADETSSAFPMIIAPSVDPDDPTIINSSNVAYNVVYVPPKIPVMPPVYYGYLAIEASAGDEMSLYLSDPDALSVYDIPNLNEPLIDLPDPIPNSHCESSGPQQLVLTFEEDGLYTFEMDLTTPPFLMLYTEPANHAPPI